MAGAAIIGSAITTLPWLVSRANIDGLWGVDVVLMPGMIVGLVVSHNVHDYSLPVVLIVSAAFYTWLVYLLLRRRASRKGSFVKREKINVNPHGCQSTSSKDQNRFQA
jgi:hypothetical protein